MRNTRLVLTLAAASLLALTTQSVVGTAQGQSIHSVTSPATSTSRALAEEQAVAANAVAAKFKDYVGSNLDATATGLDVYLAGSDPVETAQITAAAGGLPVRFHTVQYSRADLAAVQNTIGQDVASWKSQGVEIRLWGPNPLDDKVDVYVSELTPTSSDLLLQRYGAAMVKVLPAGPDEVIHNFASRQADVAPWNGGDFIYTGSGIPYCTSGPPVHSQGTGKDYLLTAGHCWDNGTPVYNGWHDPNGALHGSGTFMGTAKYSDYDANSNLDAAFVEVLSGASTLDWRTSASSTAQVNVSPSLGGGASVCASGAYEGEVCGAQINAAFDGYCYFDGTFKVCGIVRAAKAGIAVAGSGDSGGPIYRVTPSGGLDVAGIVKGGGDLFYCPNMTAGARYCSDTLYYTEIGLILNKNKVTVKTSP